MLVRSGRALGEQQADGQEASPLCLCDRAHRFRRECPWLAPSLVLGGRLRYSVDEVEVVFHSF